MIFATGCFRLIFYLFGFFVKVPVKDDILGLAEVLALVALLKEVLRGRGRVVAWAMYTYRYIEI